MKEQEVTPYRIEGKSKKEEVAQMFDQISGRYDLLNRILSLGIDRSWRKKAIRILAKHEPKQILDVATGTGDFAIASSIVKPEQISGIDISEGMLEIGRKKIDRLDLSETIQLISGDSESIPFDDNKFDAATVAFGVRNFEHLDKGLSEIQRVLRPGGMIIVLEFSKPSNRLIKTIYWFYFTKVLPVIGRLISRDHRAYSYLPESVRAFPSGSEFLRQLSSAGFKQCSQKELTFGVASIYTGLKPE